MNINEQSAPLSKTRTYLCYKIHIMDADVLGISNHDIYYVEPD